MSARSRRDAVIIGAGIGGLAAAGALAPHVGQVTIVERDPLPLYAAPRLGTPQGLHAHGLLEGGLNALLELFPGFERDLAEAGAVPIRMNLDVREEAPGFLPFPRRDLGTTIYTMSRPLLERVLRAQVERLPNVEFRQRTRAIGVMGNGRGDAVTGVRIARPAGDGEVLPADIVVDASGRGTPTLGFLRAGGLDEPPETRIGINIRYASAIFEPPRGRAFDWKAVMTFSSGPDMKRGGLLLPIEGERWLVTLNERHGDWPPVDEAGFWAFARTLRTTTIHDALADARLIGEIHRYSLPESAWRHFEAVDRMPAGLIPIGDSICRFNPVYGQGMTVAAKEAATLARLLREPDLPLTELGRRYLAETSPTIGAAWQMSAVPDFSFPETTGERPENLQDLMRFSAALQRLAAQDPEVHRRLHDLRHLVRTRAEAIDPDLARRITEEIRGELAAA